MTSIKPTVGLISQTTSLFQSCKSPSSTKAYGAKCLEAKREVTYDCRQGKTSSEILLRNLAYSHGLYLHALNGGRQCPLVVVGQS
jgi:hypothetical protein